MQPLSFNNNSQEPSHTGFQSIRLEYMPGFPPFISESQLSEKVSLYEKFSIAGPHKLEALHHPPTRIDLPDLVRDQNKQYGSVSNIVESRDQEYSQVANFELRNEQAKSYTLPKNWTKEKDEELLRLGKQYKGEWKRIASRFAHKTVTPIFVKHRFRDLTCAPKQTRIKFQPTEDLMLIKYFDKYGSDWVKIASHFPNRTPVMLKNRYYSYIRKQGMLGFLIGKARGMEQNKYAFYENPRIFLEQAIPDSRTSVYCKEETNSSSEVKLEHGLTPEIEAEIVALKKRAQFYEALFLQTKFEFDNFKAKVSEQKCQQCSLHADL